MHRHATIFERRAAPDTRPGPRRAPRGARPPAAPRAGMSAADDDAFKVHAACRAPSLAPAMATPWLVAGFLKVDSYSVASLLASRRGMQGLVDGQTDGESAVEYPTGPSHETSTPVPYASLRQFWR